MRYDAGWDWSGPAAWRNGMPRVLAGFDGRRAGRGDRRGAGGAAAAGRRARRAGLRRRRRAAGRRPGRRLRLRAAVRARPGRGGGDRGRGADVRGEAGRRRPGHRRADRRPGQAAGCSPPSATTGATWTWSTQARQLLADRPVRLVSGAWLDKVPPVAWWPRAGPLRRPGRRAGRARAGPGPACWPARSTEVTAYGDGTPPPVDGADIDGGDRRDAALRRRRGRHPHRRLRARLEAPRRPGDRRRRAGPVARPRTGWRSATPTGNGDLPADPEAARIAVDRAFVDAVRGVGDDVRVPYARGAAHPAAGLAVAERRRPADRRGTVPAARR